MNEDAREWGLYILCALLLAAVLISAWLQVPELQPVKVMPASSGESISRETLPAGAEETEKIDLNTATAAQLTALSGLGEKTAEKIVAYRETHGEFHSLEELLQIEGIGEKKLEQWSPFLTV